MASISVSRSVPSGGRITLHRGDSIVINITDTVDLTGWSKVWFTIKPQEGEYTDAQATLQILQALSGDDGLLTINGREPNSSTNGSILVTDVLQGDITVTLAAVESAKMVESTKLKYDLQWMNSLGTVQTLIAGNCSVVRDITETSS